MNNCPYFPECNGCKNWDMSYSDQILLKKQDLIKHLVFLDSLDNSVRIDQIDFRSLGASELRHRFDFTISNGLFLKMGLYNKNKEIVDLPSCLQLSPELNQVYEEFRSFYFPISKGSVRLRVSPTHEKGAWLDFSNQDIKLLLDEKNLLVSLIRAGFQIEFGQKNKRIILENNSLQVADPKAFAWFQTFNKQEKPLVLNGFISSFTQPSWTSAHEIVKIIYDWTNSFCSFTSEDRPETTKPKTTLQAVGARLKIAEFGSGLGQYTLPLLSEGHMVDAYEWDRSACENLKLNTQVNDLNNLNYSNRFNHLSDSDVTNLRIFHGNFHQDPIENIPYDVALVNPARSGLKDFVHQILKIKPRFIMYISCFPESMALDLRRLMGIQTGEETSALYKISNLKIVDQFPQTDHYETCVLLERI